MTERNSSRSSVTCGPPTIGLRKSIARAGTCRATIQWWLQTTLRHDPRWRRAWASDRKERLPGSVRKRLRELAAAPSEGPRRGLRPGGGGMRRGKAREWLRRCTRNTPDLLGHDPRPRLCPAPLSPEFFVEGRRTHFLDVGVSRRRVLQPAISAQSHLTPGAVHSGFHSHESFTDVLGHLLASSHKLLKIAYAVAPPGRSRKHPRSVGKHD